MNQLEKIGERILGRVKISLKEIDFDAAGIFKYLQAYIPVRKLVKFYAFYGVTSQHPFSFQFSNSNMSGSYFLGRCKVDHSILYKTDVRGDELKRKGDVVSHQGTEFTLEHDEKIQIKDSILVKTLVHNCSNDPANPELFLINNTAAADYANIHGSSVDGCFLQPFATADLSRLHGCSLGAYAYVQGGELWNRQFGNGQIWIKADDVFEFSYRHPKKVLDRYISFKIDEPPSGIFIDFMRKRKAAFQRVFDAVSLKSPTVVPKSSSLSRYAVVRPKTSIGENVLISQRAYLENSFLGKGANAQENCYIINSRLEGNNVTAHGANIIHARLSPNVFVGFNSFMRGTPECPLEIGQGCIVMPHTIIDLKKPLKIPPKHLVWGFIQKQEDLKNHSISLKDLAAVRGRRSIKSMKFKGDGSVFVKAFQHRIQHILEANGAFFDGRNNRGHAQQQQNMSFNIVQPYTMGKLKGLFPTLDIRP